MEVSKKQRRWLARKAHRVEPTVMIGKQGFTEAVNVRTDAELESHELIKIRFVGHKEQVREIAQLLAENTEAALVQTIGHVAVLYRPRKDPERPGIVLPT